MGRKRRRKATMMVMVASASRLCAYSVLSTIQCLPYIQAEPPMQFPVSYAIPTLLLVVLSQQSGLD